MDRQKAINITNLSEIIDQKLHGLSSKLESDNNPDANEEDLHKKVAVLLNLNSELVKKIKEELSHAG